MPIYVGSNTTAVEPAMNVSEHQFTADQINGWWDAMASGADSDREIGRELNKNPGLLLFLNDSGELVPAVRKGEDLNSVDVRGRMLAQAHVGRLFINAVKESRLRQVRVDSMNNPSFTKELSALPSAGGQLPEKPKRPFFLKFLVPFAFRKEINAYNAQKEKYDKAVQYKDMIRNFGRRSVEVASNIFKREIDDKLVNMRMAQKVNGRKLGQQVEEKRPEPRKDNFSEWVKSRERVNRALKFEGDLIDDSRANGERALDVLKQSNATPEKYCNALVKAVLQHIAQKLLEDVKDMDDTSKANYLIPQQDIYMGLTVGLQKLISGKVDMERIGNVIRDGVDNSPQLMNEIKKEHRDILLHSLGEYYKSIKPDEKKEVEAPKPEQQVQKDKNEPSKSDFSLVK